MHDPGKDDGYMWIKDPVEDERQAYTAMGLTNASSRRTKAMRTIAERCFIASPPPPEAAGRPALLRAARRQRRRAGSSGSYSGTYSMVTYSTRMYRNHLTVYSALVLSPPPSTGQHSLPLATLNM